MSVAAMKEDRPAYVTFEKVAVEDRTATLAQGRFMTKDVEYVYITPPGSTDRIPQEVEIWLEQLNAHAREGRIPQTWVDGYKAKLAAWRKSEEVPVDGTPIRGWTLISPAQQKNILSANVLTVEDLAQANGEALQRIGMGAQELKNKAIAYLKAAGDVGKVAGENAALKADNAQLAAQVKEMAETLAKLTAAQSSTKKAA